MRVKSVLIAGGGTGGHVFSGLAIAEVFKKRGVEVWFMGTAHGLEAKVVPERGFPLKTIPIVGLKRKSFFPRLYGILLLPVSTLVALVHFIRIWPDVVIGIGGYASAPGLFWGLVFRKRTAIQEQNAVPGITNRLLARFSGLVFASFRYSLPFFKDRTEHQDIFVVGNPLRADVLKEVDKPPERNSDGRFSIFVFGGSQGARAINTAFVSILPELDKLGKFRIFHQTGHLDYEIIKAAYRKGRFHFEQDIFPFTDQIYRYYRRSDLVICRGGALSVSEVLAFCKPALIIPFPGAADDHQRFNALALVGANAARMIMQSDLTGKRLLDEIMMIYRNREEREAMAVAARRIRSLDAADRIADRCLEGI